MADMWQITQDSFDPDTARAWEGLFTQGSGYLHIRGSLEEHLSDCPQNTEYMRTPGNVTSTEFPDAKARWGTYIPGIYGAHPLCGPELVNLPYFLDFCPVVESEKLDLETSDIRHFERVLDLKTAVLRREVRWHTRTKIPLTAVFERFIHSTRPHLCLQRVSFSAPDALDLRIFAGIDADVRTNGFDHFDDVRIDSLAADEIHCEVTTDAGHIVTIHSRLRGSFTRSSFLRGDRDGCLSGSLTVPAGKTVTVEKRTAIAASWDRDKVCPKEILTQCGDLSWTELLAEHAQEWQSRWAACDVDIDGDAESQRAIRSSIYHLLRSHVPDDRVAIDAKGYAGEAYWGRFFWDTEMNLLPFFLYTFPEKARTLVDFRVQALPAAKEVAKSYGYPGAKYPWESDSDGNECCPGWQYRDHEVHVTADVVYGLCHYAAACEHSYLNGGAGDVLAETARYWLARLSRRPYEDVLSLLGVMGPDEYSPISHNNAYTNTLVRFSLQTAAHCPRASKAERESFREAAEQIPLIIDDDGLILESEDFDLLAEPDFDSFWVDRTKTFAAQVSQERLYRTKCLKQADVLMMMALFPDDFSDEQVQKAWDYYLPYTTHDSSLSAGVHAVIASRLGLQKEAWEFWQMSAFKDLDVAQGGAAEGVHIAGCGNNWQVIVMGFAGFQTAVNSIDFQLYPRLPKAWKRLSFPIRWQGTPLQVQITPKQCRVANEGDTSLKVVVWGDSRELNPGETARFSKPQGS